MSYFVLADADVPFLQLVAPQRAKRRDVTASMHGAYLELAAADGSPEEKLGISSSLTKTHQALFVFPAHTCM